MLKQFFRGYSQRLVERLKVVDLATSMTSLESWINSDFGRYLLHHEQLVIDQKYSQLPGYHLLHLGLLSSQHGLSHFKHLHPFHIRSVPPTAKSPAASVISDYAQLPLPSSVVDVALLQHAVEFSASPKAVLSEVARVMAPGGHLILCLFNPFGPRGVIKFPMQLMFNRAEYRFHNLRKGRMIDWLSLLNFQVLDVDHGAFHLPLDRPEWLGKESAWEQICRRKCFSCGNFYMLHAVKRITSGIGNRAPSWRVATPGFGSSGAGMGGRGVSREPVN